MQDHKHDAAKRLADSYFATDPSVKVFYVDLPDSRIGLLVVDPELEPTGSVDPFVCRPSNGCPYKTVIAVAAPSELELVKAKSIALPDGWNLDVELQPSEDK